MDTHKPVLFMLLLSSLLFASCLNAPVAGQQSTKVEASLPPTTVSIGVDSRIELVAIVCRLAGYPEFSVDWPLRYLNEIGKWFTPYARHPAVRMARRLLIEAGIGYNAPLSLVVHADPKTLLPLVPLDPLPDKLDSRWTALSAKAFLEALADFSRDADFPGFMAAHGYLYDEVSARISGLVEKDRLIPWMEVFFGRSCRAELSILVTYLTGFRHYGLSVLPPCGCLVLSPVLGVSYWTHAEFRILSPLLSAILIHEFSHAFVDDLVDEVWDELEPFMTSLAEERKGMIQAAYAGPASLAYETVVRACDSWFTLENYGDDEALQILELHESQGFDLVRDLVPLMARYAESRETYPGFQDFMPEVIDYFRSKAGS